jgi:hypothetical protein
MLEHSSQFAQQNQIAHCEKNHFGRAHSFEDPLKVILIDDETTSNGLKNGTLVLKRLE